LSRTRQVAVALGSNLGDRDAHLDIAVSRLSALLSNALASPRYDTAPVGVTGDQPTFLNAAVVGDTDLEPHALLHELQKIEAERGRERPYVSAPRTLDLDLILFGDLVLADARLIVPHPRFRDRAFVLRPLVDIAPAMIDPVSGLTLAALLARLPPDPAAPAL
jgi:2-amino-4-hydroxy-6-hydroxymethyldihydropteridine diphosphokinase